MASNVDDGALKRSASSLDITSSEEDETKTSETQFENDITVAESSDLTGSIDIASDLEVTERDLDTVRNKACKALTVSAFPTNASETKHAYADKSCRACYWCDSSLIENICDICAINMCFSCSKYHLKDKSDHSLTPLPYAGSGDAPKTMCSMHPELQVVNWCFGCSIFTCSSSECIAAHDGHTLGSIYDDARVIQGIWSTNFDDLMSAIFDIDRRKSLAEEVLQNDKYASTMTELRRRESQMIKAIKQQSEQEIKKLKPISNGFKKQTKAYITGLDESLKSANRLRGFMVAAHQEDNATHIDVIVNALQHFNDTFPTIKQASESAPVTQPENCNLLQDDTMHMTNDIAKTLKYLQLQNQSTKSVSYATVLSNASYCIEGPMNIMYFKQNSLNAVDLSRLTLIHELNDSSLANRYSYIACDNSIPRGSVSPQKVKDHFTNMVVVGGFTVINGTRGIHILDQKGKIRSSIATGFVSETFISHYSDTHFVCLTAGDLLTRFFLIGVQNDYTMKYMKHIDFIRRIVPQHHYQIYGISDGRVVLTEDGIHLIIVHLELDMIESHDLKHTLDGAVINCVYVDYWSNILIGCSDGKIYLFGENKKLSEVYKMDTPIACIFSSGRQLIVSAIPNRLCFVKFDVG